MENQYHCMSIRQAKLILNALKHNLLNPFCNNVYVHLKQHENKNNNKISQNQHRERDRERDRQTDRQRKRECSYTSMVVSILPRLRGYKNTGYTKCSM